MTRLAFYSLILLACAVVGAPAAWAQSSANTISSAEEVAIAFYKTAGLTPSFSSWAKDTRRYHETSPARRPKIEAEEAQRLRQAYLNFVPATSTLSVVTAVQLTLQRLSEPTRYTLQWRFTVPDSDFFPYEYREQTFALVPQNLTAFQQADITREEYEEIQARLGADKQARVRLLLRAAKADAAQPMTMYGREIWPLGADITGLTMLDAGDRVIWGRNASWSAPAPLQGAP